MDHCLDDYWSKLDCFIIRLFGNDEKSLVSISFRELYSCVYKYVISNQSEVVYKHLMESMSNQVESYFQSLLPGTDGLEEHCKYICEFYLGIKNYFKALQSLLPIFKYLNKVYVKPMLGESLEDQLLNLFKKLVINHYGSKVIQSMKIAKQIPFSVDPSIMSELATMLYSMAPNSWDHEQDFFSFYVPKTKSMCLFDLDKEIEHTRHLQHDLCKQEHFRISHCASKRTNEQLQDEDNECNDSLLINLLTSGTQR